MGTATFRKGMLNAVLMVAALAALALNVVVPQGFMPARTADGTVRVVICTGHGPLTAVVDTGRHGAMEHGKHHGQSHSDTRCDFAGHAAPATPSAPAAMLADLPPYYPEFRPLPGARAAPGRGMPAPPPPSRAPPKLNA